MNATDNWTEAQWKAKAIELAKLLLEARDALPAISLASARLHRIDLSLASRIEAALEPWLLPWGEGEVKEAKGVGV